jgi:hypothetical protein
MSTMLVQMLRGATIAYQQRRAFLHWASLARAHVAAQRKAVHTLQTCARVSVVHVARRALLFWRRWAPYQATERAGVSFSSPTLSSIA